MSRGDRGARTAFLEALFWILALLGVVVIGYATGQVFGVQAARDEVTSRQHYDQEKKDALAACLGRKKSATVECVTKAIENAQEKSETRQDLYAQQDAARWGFWSVILAATSTSFTALGVWYVKRTLDATLRAVEDTSDATVAMKDANAIAETMGKAQVRAHISVQNLTFSISPEGRWTAAYEIRNNGQTPAKDIQFYARVYFIRVNPDFTQWVTSTSPVMKMVKDIVRDGNMSLSISGDIDRNYVDQMTAERAMLTIVSSAEFTDIFFDRHQEPSAFSVPNINYGIESELFGNSGYMWFAKHIHTTTGFNDD